MDEVRGNDYHQRKMEEAKLRGQKRRTYVCEVLDLPPSNLPWTNFNQMPEFRVYAQERLKPICGFLRSVFDMQPALASKVKDKVWYFTTKWGGVAQTAETIKDIPKVSSWEARRPENEFLFITQKQNRPYAIHYVSFGQNTDVLRVRSFIYEDGQIVDHGKRQVFDILAGFRWGKAGKKFKYIKDHPEINSALYFQEKKSQSLYEFSERRVTGFRIGAQDIVSQDKEKVMGIISLTPKGD